MKGIRLTLSYDGRDFSGWQKQPSQRTVQGVVEDAIETMVGERVDLRGTSRTDAGVHAEGQVAAFDSPKDIEPRGFLLGLNTRLPDDVSVVDAAECTPGYAPRFDSVEKTYRYLVLFGEPRRALWRERAWHVSRCQTAATSVGRGAQRIKLETIEDSLSILLGTHDFSAFRAADDTRENTVRTLHEIRIASGFADVPELVAFDVRGSAFMKQMVRILVGTLVEVGRQRITRDALAALLEPGASRANAGPTAPAHGLTLRSIVLGRDRQTS